MLQMNEATGKRAKCPFIRFETTKPPSKNHIPTPRTYKIEV